METTQDQASKIIKGEEYSLEDKAAHLFELGFNPFNLKLLTKDYRNSKCAMSGVAIDCGHFAIRIGPQNHKTMFVKALKTAPLDHLGINPFAVRALAREFIDSKIKNDGLMVKIDDIVVMVGKQGKNTQIVR